MLNAQEAFKITDQLEKNEKDSEYFYGNCDKYFYTWLRNGAGCFF